MPSVATDGLSVTHAANQTGPPDLRLIHYNDVYHVEYGSPTVPIHSFIPSHP